MIGDTIHRLVEYRKRCRAAREAKERLQSIIGACERGEVGPEAKAQAERDLRAAQAAASIYGTTNAAFIQNAQEHYDRLRASYAARKAEDREAALRAAGAPEIAELERLQRTADPKVSALFAQVNERKIATQRAWLDGASAREDAAREETEALHALVASSGGIHQAIELLEEDD